MKGKRLPVVLLVILAISLPLLLIGIKQTLDGRSRAAAPDKLETESGTLNGNAVSKADSTASGGNYVEIGANQTSSPPSVGTGSHQSCASINTLGSG